MAERKLSCSPSKAIGSSPAIGVFIAIIKVGDPMLIAFGSLYLASDEARYVTGAELWNDSGRRAAN